MRLLMEGGKTSFSPFFQRRTKTEFKRSAAVDEIKGRGEQACSPPLFFVLRRVRRYNHDDKDDTSAANGKDKQ